MKLTDLPNIGEYGARQLENAGIRTAEELKAAGSLEAFKRIRANDPGACLSLFSALEGAIRGVRRHALPPEVKKRLASEFDNLKE